MANSMTGRVHFVSPTETIVSKSDANKTFQKRLIVLDCTRYDQYTGERGFDNFPSFEFSGDKCQMLDGYKEGDIATVWLGTGRPSRRSSPQSPLCGPSFHGRALSSPRCCPLPISSGCCQASAQS